MKLTKAEAKWIADMQELLASCPSKRLGFFTIGDPDITVYDYRKEGAIMKIMDNGSSDYGNAVDKAGADLNISLKFPNCVHSVAG